MFDTEGWWGTRIEYSCPRAVWLVLHHAFPPRRVRHDDVPLRVRAAGLDLARVEPAELRVVLTNRTERARHDARLFVPAAAVRPREADTDTAPRGVDPA